MTKKYYHSYKESKVEIFSMSKKFPSSENSTWKEKSNATKQSNHCFHYGNYAQITSKQFHLLFLHNDNKSNSGQIGQVVAMGGSGKTKDFFLCFDPASLPIVELILCHERHHQL